MADPRDVPLGTGLVERAKRALLGARERRERAVEVAVRGSDEARRREAQTTDSNNSR